MKLWPVICGAASAFLWCASVAAEPGSTFESNVEPEAKPLPRLEQKDAPREDGYFAGRVHEGFRDHYWVLGVGAEYFASAAKSVASTGEELVGLTAMWRLGAFGPHSLLMVKPGVDRFQDSRVLAGLGLRGFYEIPGLTELSYGVGGHAEARLADHFWLAYLTPLELGAVVWRKGSWNIETFVGLRRAVAGNLINYYLIDPNGFDNGDASDNLDDVLHGTPWRVFARVVFGRRVD
ncbi:MAG: hypothetical protein H6718_22320 [Polyangiaceae bacterium]|nr:hypothetical protein [Myxococcales bacterium]MCB9588160.1 hypothetical protein [Polyangiaceae bacterium]